MAGPTFILSIWELVDGALGTQHSRGAAAHTVGPISKMGTLGTSIRALGGKEKVKKNGVPRSIPYLLTRTNPAIQDPPSTNPSTVWPPCASLEVGPYRSLDSPVRPALSPRPWCRYCTEPLHVAVPSKGWHSGWQEKHSASWANSRGSLQ